MKTDVTLRWTDAGADKVPEAVLLSGPTLATLLEELCAWPIPTQDLRVVLLSDGKTSSLTDLFVFLPKGRPRVPGLRGQPYVQAGEGFYVPAGALLWPPVSPEELKALRLYHVCVYHPVLGLFGLEAREVLLVSDLLRAPAVRRGEWTGVVAEGDEQKRQLRSVRLEKPLQLEEIYGEESREIGSEPVSGLAPTPLEEAKKTPRRLAQKGFARLAKFLMRLTALVPRSAQASPTWVNAVENWAQRQFSDLMRELEKARNSEIERLQQLLKDNPEEGLKHAISLAKLEQRGKAPPTARLPKHPLDFDLRRLGGGRPGDTWTLSEAARQNLLRLYRENAQREMQLGRHRRAAYIFAELLGDYSSAADALTQGRFFREAALLYREKLKRPEVAANVLAQGGFFVEAIDIYEQFFCWIEAAELHRKLGNEPEAEVDFRKAILTFKAQGDFIAAARLLEQKVGRPDEALALLATTWPDGKQALDCLEETVEILRRHGRLREWARLFEDLLGARTPPGLVCGVIAFAAKVAESPCEASIRKLATELVVQKAAVVLSEGGFEGPEELKVLKALTRTAPKDRLLQRDAHRFRVEKKGIEIQKRLPGVTALLKTLTLERTKTHSFPGVSGWIRVAPTENGMAALARSRNGKYVVTGGTWMGAQQSVEFPNPAAEQAAVYFHVYKHHIIVGEAFAAPLVPMVMEGSHRASRIRMMVGTPNCLPEDTVQVAGGKGAVWSVRLSEGQPILCGYIAGKQAYSRDVGAEMAEAQTPETGKGVFLDAVGGLKSVALAYCRTVLVKTDQNMLLARRFDRPIIGLSPGPSSLPGWVVRHDEGASYLTERALVTTVLDERLVTPEAFVLGDGRLVVASADSGLTYHVVDGALKPAGIFKMPAHERAIIGMLPAKDPDEFAVAYDDGVFHRFRLSV